MTVGLDSSGGRALRPLAMAGIAGGLLMAAAVTLWVHYGTVVFVDMIQAGFNACF